MNNSRRNFLKVGATIPALGILPTRLSVINPVQSLPPKLKLSLNVYSFNNLLREGKIDLFDVLDFCAVHDLDAIDPTGYYFPGYPKAADDDYLFQFKRKAFLLGINISGTGIRNDFANPDPEKRQESIELILSWIKVAAKLGAPNLRIFTGRSQYDGFSKEEVMQWMARDIRICCLYGKQFGVMIALQNHNEFLKTADEVDQLFELVDSEWLGLNLDIGSYREKDPYQEIQQNIKHAITWQIKEHIWINAEKVPTDLVKLFKMIKHAGYRGYLPLETLGPGDPFEKVPSFLMKARMALAEI